MKSLLLTILIFSTQAHASLTCDLNVKVSQYENVQTKNIVVKGFNQINEYDDSSFAAAELVLELITECEEQGAIDCTLLSTGYERSGSSVIISQIVGGQLTTGEKLSDRKYAKKVKAAVCTKIDSCISDVLNDSAATENDLNKLYSVQKAKDCN